MNIEYRIASKNSSHFPQVRIKMFLFWGPWQKISKHPTIGFGLYESSDTKYPQTEDKCKEIIRDFDIWYREGNNGGYSYKPFAPFGNLGK